MKLSLRKKYIVFGILLIVGFLAFLFSSALFFQNKMTARWNNEKMTEVAGEALEVLEGTKGDIEEAELDTIAFENNVSVTVTDEDYKILYSTRKKENSRGFLGDKSRKAIEQTKEQLDENGQGFVSYFDDDNKASFIHISKVDGLGYLVVRRSIMSFKSSIYVMKFSFMVAAGVTLLLGILVLFVLTGRMVRPIRELSRVTGQIADLHFDEKVPVNTRDELGELAVSVNRMSDRLKETMETLQQDVEKRKLLVRNMSHELKTPVAVIMGYAENMEYIAAQNPEKLAKYCRVIAQECDRMDALISKMLEVSACEIGASAMSPQQISGERLLEEVKKSYEAELSGHKGTYQEENRLSGQFYGDFWMLQRALYNLVKNAVRHGSKEGKILVSLWEKEDKIYFCVYNEGSHIPEEEQEKVWGEFYKIDHARPREEDSFGIGLSIVRQTALAHGGGTLIKNQPEGVEVGFYILAHREHKPEI